MLEKYGYEMQRKSSGYFIQDSQNIKVYIPFGANHPDEEVAMKALGFNKTRNTQH